MLSVVFVRGARARHLWMRAGFVALALAAAAVWLSALALATAERFVIDVGALRGAMLSALRAWHGDDFSTQRVAAFEPSVFAILFFLSWPLESR